MTACRPQPSLTCPHITSTAPPLSLVQTTVCFSLSHLSITYWFSVLVPSIWLFSAAALGQFHFLCLSYHSSETGIFHSQQLKHLVRRVTSIDVFWWEGLGSPSGSLNMNYRIQWSLFLLKSPVFLIPAHTPTSFIFNCVSLACLKLMLSHLTLSPKTCGIKGMYAQPRLLNSK